MRASAIQVWMTPCSASGLPNGRAREHPVAHQLEGPLGGADGAHAVMDPPGAEAGLGDGEAASLLAQEVGLGHTNVVVADLGVALRIGVAEDRQVADDLHARGVERHQDHALLAVGRGASGSVLPITMAIRHAVFIAPDVHHLRPLMT